MWSKTRQILLSRIAPTLQGRIDFIRGKFNVVGSVFSVTVDGKTWFADCFYYYMHPRFTVRETLSKRSFAKKYPNLYRQEFCSIEKSIHKYLNVLPIEKCLDYEEKCHFCNILAVLDYRLGKRSIKKILASIDSCPDYLYRWIILRAEAEGLLKKEELC